MQVKLPNLGEGAGSSPVASVLVSVGDTVEKDQTILELEMEKSVVPVPSSAGGKVTKVYVSVGDKIGVGDPILDLEGAGDAGDSGESSGGGDSEPAPKAKPAAAPAPARSSRAGRESVSFDDYFDFEEEIDPNAPMPPASPSVRRTAREIGVDLRRIHGTGGGGRVIMSDLRAFVRWCQMTAFRQAGEAAREGVFQPRSKPSIDFSQFGEISKKPMSSLRKVIAERMVENKNTLPHVTQFDSVDITDLNALRKKLAPAYKEKGSNLTMTVITLMAVVRALRKHPIFNASLDEVTEEIILKEYYHIGMAVDSDAGLMVPVIRNADRKSPLELATDLKTLAAKVRDRQISGDEMKGGSFTISNQGAIGGGHFTPIINKPETAIMGVGQSSLQPAVVDGQIVPRLLMPITISYDHRLIDGGTAARFTVDLKNAFTEITEADLAL
jgi:pyruvate dehydrogenase E2 component (dihydrolipoamide acetyltransferase)